MNGIGEAGIAKARVTLPSSEFIANAHFNTICTRVQFKEANPGSYSSLIRLGTNPQRMTFTAKCISGSEKFECTWSAKTQLGVPLSVYTETKEASAEEIGMTLTHSTGKGCESSTTPEFSFVGEVQSKAFPTLS